MNAITYKEVFPLLKDNQIWLGTTKPKEFIIYDESTVRSNRETTKDGKRVAKFGNICWFTNVDHGLRHKELQLDTMEHNLKFNKKLRNKLEKDYEKIEYPHYDNYDAIEVPFTECIPSDYDGVMGIPITFMDKYNPDQFEILEGSNRYGILNTWNKNEEIRATHSHGNNINNKATYFRVHIRKKKGAHQ